MQNLTHEKAHTLKTDEEKRLKRIARTTLGKRKVTPTSPAKEYLQALEGSIRIPIDQFNASNSK